MLMTTPFRAPGLLRAVALLARQADAALVHGAAHNAAVGVAESSARRLDDARTLRDLKLIGVPGDAAEIIGG